MRKPEVIIALQKTLDSRVNAAIQKDPRLSAIVQGTMVTCRESSMHGKYDATYMIHGATSEYRFEYPITVPATNADIENATEKVMQGFRKYLIDLSRRMKRTQNKASALSAKEELKKFRSSL